MIVVVDDGGGGNVLREIKTHPCCFGFGWALQKTGTAQLHNNSNLTLKLKTT